MTDEERIALEVRLVHGALNSGDLRVLISALRLTTPVTDSEVAGVSKRLSHACFCHEERREVDCMPGDARPCANCAAGYLITKLAAQVRALTEERDELAGREQRADALASLCGTDHAGLDEMVIQAKSDAKFHPIISELRARAEAAESKLAAAMVALENIVKWETLAPNTRLTGTALAMAKLHAAVRIASQALKATETAATAKTEGR